MCVGWRPGWGASGLPPLPLNYWWTEESGVLVGIQNQLRNKDKQTEMKYQITDLIRFNPGRYGIYFCPTPGNFKVGPAGRFRFGREPSERFSGTRRLWGGPEVGLELLGAGTGSCPTRESGVLMRRSAAHLFLRLRTISTPL